MIKRWIEPLLLDDEQLKVSWALVFAALVLLYGMSVSGCASWQLDEVSATGRMDHTRYGLTEYGADRATGGELTFTWRRKISQ